MAYLVELFLQGLQFYLRNLGFCRKTRELPFTLHSPSQYSCGNDTEIRNIMTYHSLLDYCQRSELMNYFYIPQRYNAYLLELSLQGLQFYLGNLGISWYPT